MAPLTPDQLRTRDRFESIIRLMAPGLNLMLAAGERLSRIVEPDDQEYYPIRSTLPGGAEERAEEERADPA